MSLAKIKKMIYSGEIALYKVSIGGDLPGFVYSSRKGKYHIFVDDTLSPDAENDVILHECGHIIMHAASAACTTIGLDDCNHDREKEAEQFVRECKAKYVTRLCPEERFKGGVI